MVKLLIISEEVRANDAGERNDLLIASNTDKSSPDVSTGRRCVSCMCL